MGSVRILVAVSNVHTRGIFRELATRKVKAYGPTKRDF